MQVLCRHPLLKFMVISSLLWTLDLLSLSSLLTKPLPSSDSQSSLPRHLRSPEIPDPIFTWCMSSARVIAIATPLLGHHIGHGTRPNVGLLYWAIKFSDYALRIKKILLSLGVPIIPCFLSLPHFPRYSHHEGDMQGH